MDTKEKRQRLINMRECLRWVQTRLPSTEAEEETTKGSEFICINIDKSHFDQQTKDDTTNLIYRALLPNGTFNSWMYTHNNNYPFGYTEMMQYRQRWINQLCRDITKEIHRLRVKEPDPKRIYRHPMERF